MIPECRNAELVWTERGTWLFETADGVEHVSDLGWHKLGGIDGIKAWCESRGIKISVIRSHWPARNGN